MDPNEVPDELQNLTEIEEMLIARVFLESRKTLILYVKYQDA